MPHNLKVMSVLNLYPQKLGSFEEYTLFLSQRLTHLGGQSILVFDRSPPEALRPLYTAAGAVLESKPFDPFGWESVRTLYYLLRKHRPDIVHLHFVNMLSLDVLVAFLHPGTKLVFTEHASGIEKKRTMLKRCLLQAGKRVFSSLIDQVIAPSNYVNKRLVGEGVRASKVVTVYNGINVGSFRHVPAAENIHMKYGIEPGDFIIASISLLIPEKGIGDLIEAAALILKQGKKVSFIHVGDGPCEAEYRNRTRQLGIDKYFIFAGLLNSWDIASIRHQSNAFTSPSTWGEAFGLAIHEAMSVGKPLIVTDVGAIEEAVEDGKNGLVIPPHDVQALATAIMTLYDNPGRCSEMGKESIKRSVNFTMQRWVDETMKIYSRI